jgi:nucleoside-diphosphate-sugar epimerase
MAPVSPSDGPVTVTGASGYIGSHVVSALVASGFTVRACVTDPGDPARTDHLLKINGDDSPGRIELHSADLLRWGSYDRILADCSAVLHVGTPGSHGGPEDQVYEGLLFATRNLLASVRKAGSIRRFVYTSSFAAVSHPVTADYTLTEADWAAEPSWWSRFINQAVPNWADIRLQSASRVAYPMAKVASERLVNRTAAEDGRFDAVTVCPCTVLGPLLSRVHYFPDAWQGHLARLLAGSTYDGPYHGVWRIVDARDVGKAQASILESDVREPGGRYLLTARDASGELDVSQIQVQLQILFPDYEIGGAPPDYRPGNKDVHASCDKAIRDLGLVPRPARNTLLDTARSLFDLGLARPKSRTSRSADPGAR